LALILFAASLSGGASVAASSATPFELAPGVIVDPVRGVVYLMNPQRGIDAIAFPSGKLIWRTASAAKPLLLFDDRLVAQAEAVAAMRALRVAVLNIAAHGEPVQSASLPLAAPAFASIDDGMGISFTADARVSAGNLEVSWRFTQRTVTGFARPGPAPVLETNGAARIDLKTGRSQPLPAREAPTQPRMTPLPPSLQKLVDSRALPSTPQRAGKFYIATGSADGGKRAVVRRWDGAAGGALADIELDPGFNFGIASADGEMLLARKPLGADATGWRDYLWAIYSLETREKIAEIRMPTSAAPFFVWNSMLVIVSRPFGRRINGKWTEEPLELRAFDLKTRGEAWKAPIRDTTYRGPYPPRP
jgi:hypothetical protein